MLEYDVLTLNHVHVCIQTFFVNCNSVNNMTIKNLRTEIRQKGTILKKGMWIGVDVMMLAYSMLSTATIWRQQTQEPPVPQKGVWKYMHKCYQTHKFVNNDQVLVFVFDTRRNKFKAERYKKRAAEIQKAQVAVEKAKTLE